MHKEGASSINRKFPGEPSRLPWLSMAAMKRAKIRVGLVSPLMGDLQREGAFVLTEAILCNWDGRPRGCGSPEDGKGQRNFGRAMSELHRKGFVGL